MKKLGVLMVVLLFATGMTFAQERGGGQRPSQSQQGRPGGNRQQMSPEERLKQQTQRLVDELKLNKDQEAKVSAIFKKSAQNSKIDFSKMRDASDDERAQMRAEMLKESAARDKEIKAVLTAPQVKLYEESQKKREESRRNGQGRMGGPSGQGQ